MRYILVGILVILTVTCLSWLHWTLGFVAAGVLLYFTRFKPWQTGSLAFIRFFIAWAVLAWYWDWRNESLLSQQIGELFGGLAPITLILLTGLVGGIPAFLIGLCVSLVRSS